MPLKLFSFADKGQVAVLNRWADWIETQLKGSQTKIEFATNTANLAINKPTPPSTSVSDGLIHGDLIWDVDPAVFWVRDDFSSINFSGAGHINSQTQWLASTVAGPSSPVQNMAPPYFGGLLFWNDGTSNHSVPMLYGGFTSGWSGAAQIAWPLFEYPRWKMVWEFQVTLQYGFTNSSPPTVFNWAQVSFYMGLGNFPSTGGFTSGTSPRPSSFVGLRYDTDPTSPAITDTDFVFEGVTQASNSVGGRLNTQGTVIHTGITPTNGKHYRLEMTCTSTGAVLMLLTDGTTVFSSTLTVPQYSITQSIEYGASNGVGYLNPSSVFIPAGPGTNLQISGNTGIYAPFNGTQTVVGGTTSNAWTNILLGGTITFGTSSSTLTCYPAVVPYFAFGNDTSATPVSNTKAVVLDFFAFVWNPGVGAGTGSPNSTLPRYF